MADVVWRGVCLFASLVNSNKQHFVVASYHIHKGVLGAINNSGLSLLLPFINVMNSQCSGSGARLQPLTGGKRKASRAVDCHR